MMSQLFLFILTIISITVSSQYIDLYSTAAKDKFTNVFLRDLLDRMRGKDNSESIANYYDIEGELPKELEMALRSYQQAPEDYDLPRMFTHAANPTLRDQEYIQHSSLWGGQQFMPSELTDSTKVLPMAPSLSFLKTDTSLPAYCNPPNPCPNGYDASYGCIIDFENTALYSREYQAAQDCTCDSEHMFDCGGQQQQQKQQKQQQQQHHQQQHHHQQQQQQSDNSRGSNLSDSDSNTEMISTMEKFLMHQFQNNNRLENANPSTALAKKLFGFGVVPKNPFLDGDKLPIAAKKGIHIKI